MSNILVFAQVADGVVHDVSLQALVKARALADSGGGTVACLAIGSDLGETPAALFGYGADAVFVADDPRLEHYLSTPFRKVAESFLSGHSFEAVLFPGTTVGNDLAPLLAATSGAACVLDADDVQAVDGQVQARRMEFDRKVFTTYAAAPGKQFLVTLKDGIADAPALDSSRTGEPQAVEVALADADVVAKVVSRDVTAKTVNLKDARIIVSAGAGLGNEENFAKVSDLAKKLGAEVGATRAVVDAGWLTADHQIGQTGATVKPDLYIACGISGAVQHWVGMSESKTIVAINTDAAAPIMKRAHYRIEGDVNDVVPKLIKALG